MGQHQSPWKLRNCSSVYYLFWNSTDKLLFTGTAQTNYLNVVWATLLLVSLSVSICALGKVKKLLLWPHKRSDEGYCVHTSHSHLVTYQMLQIQVSTQFHFSFWERAPHIVKEWKCKISASGREGLSHCAMKQKMHLCSCGKVVNTNAKETAQKENHNQKRWKDFAFLISTYILKYTSPRNGL